MSEGWSAWSWWRWFVIALGLIVLFMTGISIFITPKYEVLYRTDPTPILRGSKGPSCIYDLELGNTGREAQEEVLVTLRKEVVRRAIWGPEFSDFGVSRRDVRVTEGPLAVTYALGRVKRDVRISMHMVLLLAENEEPYTWDDVLVAVAPAQGEAKVGDPAMTMFARIIFFLFG